MQRHDDCAAYHHRMSVDAVARLRLVRAGALLALCATALTAVAAVRFGDAQANSYTANCSASAMTGALRMHLWISLAVWAALFLATGALLIFSVFRDVVVVAVSVVLGASLIVCAAAVAIANSVVCISLVP